MDPHDDSAPAEILVVDDHVGVRTLVRIWLERNGYAVRLAGTPTRAQALLASPDFPFSLLLTDYTMPGMDGVTLAAHARRHRPNLPVLIMTAEPRASLPGRVLRKPFDEQELLRAVRAALRARA